MTYPNTKSQFVMYCKWYFGTKIKGYTKQLIYTYKSPKIYEQFNEDAIILSFYESFYIKILHDVYAKNLLVHK
jgi:hypothetical protein